MGAPRTSKYRYLFDNLPLEFQEDITIIHRVKNGTDDYGHPTFSEILEEVVGRFEVLNQPDRVPEEGGLRGTTQARIFLKLTPNILDTFQYVGVPDPAIWEITDGTPEVDGTWLLLEPLNVGPFSVDKVQAIEPLLFGELELRVDLTGGFTQPTFGFFAAGGYRTYFNMLDATHVDVVSQNGGAQEFDTITVPTMTIDVWKLIWAQDKVEFYLNNNLLKTFSTEVPQIALQALLSGGVDGPRDVKVDWVEIITDPLAPSNIIESDQFEIRGKRWAQIKTEYQTHLQSELLVQEVIP